MDGGHMQQPPISPDHISIPSLHPLPPSLIPPHSVSHSANVAPINSPPRTTAPTAPTAPSCLGILPDSDKCNVSQFVQEEAQVKPIDGSPNTPSKHNKEIKAPMIGMKFDCDDSAYEFYKQYAHRMGFSVRKQYVKRGSAGHVKRRTFCCSKEGERAIDKRCEQVGRKCKFFQWLDDEICERGKVLIPEQRQRILTLEAQIVGYRKREKRLLICLGLSLVISGMLLCLMLLLVG